MQRVDDAVLTAQRKDLILATLRGTAGWSPRSLAAQLDLSEDTIRRDLRELAADGLLHRVHGGALPASPAVADFAARTAIGTGAKVEVGRAAAWYDPDRRSRRRGYDGRAARPAPAPRPSATVVTHSPTIAVELATHPTVEVIVVGGRLFKHSVVAAGAAAHEAIGRISADAFFLGVTGVHPSAGLTTGDADEAAIKRAWSHRAAETFVLGSGEKIGAASAFEVVPFASVTAVLTDTAAPARGRGPAAAGRGAPAAETMSGRARITSRSRAAAHRAVVRGPPTDWDVPVRHPQALLPRRDRGR